MAQVIIIAVNKYEQSGIGFQTVPYLKIEQERSECAEPETRDISKRRGPIGNGRGPHLPTNGALQLRVFPAGRYKHRICACPCVSVVQTAGALRIAGSTSPSAPQLPAPTTLHLHQQTPSEEIKYPAQRLRLRLWRQPTRLSSLRPAPQPWRPMLRSTISQPVARDMLAGTSLNITTIDLRRAFAAVAAGRFLANEKVTIVSGSGF